MLYLATDTGLYCTSPTTGQWNRLLDVSSAQRVAHSESSLYCAARQGLWVSVDAGENWEQIFKNEEFEAVTSLEVCPNQTLCLGTEMSAVLFSHDSGKSWTRSRQLETLPSSSDWSFPPRPETHHVRWLECSPQDPQCIHAAIEAGALLRSSDGGQTWRDRVSGSPLDTHHLAIHPERPARLWSAAGDGIFTSQDNGDSWQRCHSGLESTYGWSIAIDSGDSDNVVVSVAPGPRQAHSEAQAYSTLYRKAHANDCWVEIREGLPSPDQHCAFVLASDPQSSGVFYASSAGECTYCSVDGGASWSRIPYGDRPSTGRCHSLLWA